ncbi:substrate-binding domain-containing protein [Ignisphaera sp. 4213-co]|uniref:Substrate-binding domain-containing protein n=1 Tax=Ignisphaera cupida TaxID=3050454 RepID=A0ABD4Z4I3_9CREN|nr:substrate-binding domain-containing protein [Ignisphaera sp. 4213-co]MDK6027872.1 substrate-binding domain-containing protein [Ignisphaera sp. 4213-co]
MGFEQDVVYRFRGVEVMNRDVAKLLVNVLSYGSINKASKAVGINYSRAWSIVRRVGLGLGGIGSVYRGGRFGGGVKLSSSVVDLLKRYLASYQRISFEKPSFSQMFLYYRGSHDIALEYLLRMLEERGFLVFSEFVGSFAGLASLSLGESDFAGIHIVDENLRPSNIRFVKKLGLENRVVVVRGYDRLQGFMARSSIGSLEDVAKSIATGVYTIALRPASTGTRMIFNVLLDQWIEKLGGKNVMRFVEGETHVDVANTIKSGVADIGLGIAYAAKLHNLKFAPVTWESFDFVFLAKSIDPTVIKIFSSILKDKDFQSFLESCEGYRIPKDIGEILAIT